ncbi:MAG: dTDP-4-dehydrorhamnose reductase [Magnetococcales bacterium]|nr:dTDP-4-dehydrorhamnose reductase [Magnetococcales bacterium]
MKKVLLTGASGQLGRALTVELSRESDILALSHGQLDITDYVAVRDCLRHHRPDWVINTAAWTDVDAAESDPRSALAANALGPRHLAAVCEQVGIPLVQISSDYCFDGVLNRPLHEFDATNPLSVYGRSKWLGEEEVRRHHSRHLILRTAWLYHVSGRNFPLTILGLARKGPLRVVDDQVGSPTFAPHLAVLIPRLMREGCFGTWHTAGSGAVSWYELTLALLQRAGVSCEVTPVTTEAFPRPARRPAFSALTTFLPPELRLPSWEEGVADFVAGI